MQQITFSLQCTFRYRLLIVVTYSCSIIIITIHHVMIIDFYFWEYSIICLSWGTSVEKRTWLQIIHITLIHYCYIYCHYTCIIKIFPSQVFLTFCFFLVSRRILLLWFRVLLHVLSPVWSLFLCSHISPFMSHQLLYMWHM